MALIVGIDIAETYVQWYDEIVKFERRTEAMKQIRTIGQMHKDLLADDPHCALTKTALRRLVVTGVIPSTRVGQKYLISREAVEKFMEVNAQ